MSFADFGELAELDTPALRAVLRSGDGRERLWAAWELGLRLNEAAAPALAPGAQPDPGVRYHLVVVLAGFQHTDVLRTLAVDDPDPEVRAVACDYLCRVTRSEDVAPTARFLDERARLETSPVPIVRILEAWPETWPRLGAEGWRRLARHPDRSVRLAFLGHLERRGEAGTEARDVVFESLAHDPDPDVLIAKAKFLGPGRCADVLASRAADDPGLAPPLLGFLVAEGETLGWDRVRAHLLVDDPVVVHRALRLADHAACAKVPEYRSAIGRLVQWGEYRTPDGVSALVDREAARRRARADAYGAAIELALERMWELLAKEVPLPADFRRALDTVLRRLEDELIWFLEEDLEYLEEEGVDITGELADLNERRSMVLRAKERMGAARPPDRGARDGLAQGPANAEEA